MRTVTAVRQYIVKRTFEARHYPAGSPGRIKLELSDITSSFQKSKKFVAISKYPKTDFSEATEYSKVCRTRKECHKYLDGIKEITLAGPEEPAKKLRITYTVEFTPNPGEKDWDVHNLSADEKAYILNDADARVISKYALTKGKRTEEPEISEIVPMRTYGGPGVVPKCSPDAENTGLPEGCTMIIPSTMIYDRLKPSQIFRANMEAKLADKKWPKRLKNAKINLEMAKIACRLAGLDAQTDKTITKYWIKVATISSDKLKWQEYCPHCETQVGADELVAPCICCGKELVVCSMCVRPDLDGEEGSCGGCKHGSKMKLPPKEDLR